MSEAIPLNPGAPATPAAQNVVFGAEDLRTLAKAHELFGNDRRANELRNLIGDKPKGPVAAFFTRPITITMTDVLVFTTTYVALTAGARYLRKRREQKQLASVTALPVAPTAPAPFQVAR